MYIASKAGNLQERKKDKGVKEMNQEKRRKFKLFFYCIGVIISIFALYAFIFVAELATGWKIFLEYYRSWMDNISYIRYFGESWEKVSLSENFGKRFIDKANRFVCQVLRKQSSRGQNCHCIAPRTSLPGL